MVQLNSILATFYFINRKID